MENNRLKLKYSGLDSQGLAYGWYRYAGPKPPKGKKHLYRFTLYALKDNIAMFHVGKLL